MGDKVFLVCSVSVKRFFLLFFWPVLLQVEAELMISDDTLQETFIFLYSRVKLEDFSEHQRLRVLAGAINCHSNRPVYGCYLLALD